MERAQNSFLKQLIRPVLWLVFYTWHIKYLIVYTIYYNRKIIIINIAYHYYISLHEHQYFPLICKIQVLIFLLLDEASCCYHAIFTISNLASAMKSKTSRQFANMWSCFLNETVWCLEYQGCNSSCWSQCVQVIFLSGYCFALNLKISLQLVGPPRISVTVTKSD